jgi:hypothetical protein
MRATLSVTYQIGPGKPRWASYVRARNSLEQQMRDAGFTPFHLRAAFLTFSEAGFDHFILSAYEGPRPQDCGCARGDCRPHNVVLGLVMQHMDDPPNRS